MRRKVNYSFIIPLVILAAIGLRFYKLTSKSVWYDEMEYLWRIGVLSVNEILSYPDTHMPLFSIIMKLWSHLCGNSVFALRLFPALAGVGSVFLIFKVTEILFNKRVGIIAAFLLAVSPFHIFYSQEIGEFSLFLFLTLLCAYFILKAFKNNRLRWYIFFLLSLYLVVFTHYYSIFFLVSINIYFLFQIKRYRAVVLKLFLAEGIVFLSLIPLILMYSSRIQYINGFVHSRLCWMPVFPFFRGLIDMFQTFSYGGSRYGGWDIFIPSKDLIINNFLFIILITIFIHGLFTRYGEDALKTKMFLALWLFLGFVLSWIFSRLFFPILLGRHLIYSLPAFYILIAYGLMSIKKPIFRYSVIISVIVLNLYPLSYYFNNELKIPWNKIDNYLTHKRISDKDMVIFNPFLQVDVLPQVFYDYKTKGSVKNKVPVGFFKKMLTHKLSCHYFFASPNKHIVYSVSVDLFKDSKIFLIQTRWAPSCIKINRLSPISLYDFPSDPIGTRDYFINNLVKEKEVIFDYKGKMITSWNNFRRAFYNARGVYVGIFHFKDKDVSRSAKD